MQRLGRWLWSPNALVSDVLLFPMFSFFSLSCQLLFPNCSLTFLPIWLFFHRERAVRQHQFVDDLRTVIFLNLRVVTSRSLMTSKVHSKRYHIAKIPIVVMSIEKGNDVSENSWLLSLTMSKWLNEISIHATGNRHICDLVQLEAHADGKTMEREWKAQCGIYIT